QAPKTKQATLSRRLFWGPSLLRQHRSRQPEGLEELDLLGLLLGSLFLLRGCLALLGDLLLGRLLLGPLLALLLRRLPLLRLLLRLLLRCLLLCGLLLRRLLLGCLLRASLLGLALLRLLLRRSRGCRRRHRHHVCHLQFSCLSC